MLAYLLQALLIGWRARRLVAIPWRYRAFVEAAAVTGGAVALAALLPEGGVWLGARVVLAAAPLAWLGLLVRRLRGARAPDEEVERRRLS